MRTVFLVPMALWCALASGSAAAQTEETAVARLARTGMLACEPALPLFCANIHVNCAGPSRLRAFAFTLRASASGGSIEPASDPSGVAEPFADARVEWDSGGASAILRPRQGNGYVNLLADGRYVFRYYGLPEPLMSRGVCR